MLTVTDACTACGLCARVCPAYALSLEEGRPASVSDGCIRCGHCEAVCPRDALQNALVPRDERPLLPEGPVIAGDVAELFLRSRRSVRCFRREPVPRELTARLLDIGRYAQTGSNSQGVSFLVVSTGVLEELRQLVLDFYRADPDPMARRLYDSFLTPDRDRLLRGAPMCILALTRRDSPHLAKNAQFALTYVEALAPALELGTCWAGYLERYLLTDHAAMRRLLKLPGELAVSGALLYGYPQVRYRRAVGREPLRILWR